MSLLVIGCAHRSRQTRRRCPGGSQSLAETLASLPQELERGGEGALRSGALRIGVVLFDEACLKSRSDFGGRLDRLIDGPVPTRCRRLLASIPRSRLRLLASPGIERSPQRRTRMPFLVRPWDVMILLRGGSISAGSSCSTTRRLLASPPSGRSTGRQKSAQAFGSWSRAW